MNNFTNIFFLKTLPNKGFCHFAPNLYKNIIVQFFALKFSLKNTWPTSPSDFFYTK